MSMNNYGKLLCSNNFERPSRVGSAKQKRLSDDIITSDDVVDDAYELEKISQLNNQTKLAKYKQSNFPLLRSSSLTIDSQRSNPILKKHSNSSDGGSALKRVNFTANKTEYFDVEETVSTCSEKQRSIGEDQIEIVDVELGEETTIPVETGTVKTRRKKRIVKGI